MATLAGNTIASTYALLLKIDSSGIDTTLRAVEDGDATDSALLLATNKVEVKPGSNDANAFEVSQADGTAVLTVNTSTVGATLIGALTVGADDLGHDVIFYGDTASSNMTWDTSEDDLVLNDATLFIDQDDNADCINIDFEGTSGNCIEIQAPTSTTGTCLLIQNANSLTTGGCAEFHSNSSDTSTRNVVYISNDHTSATGAVALKIQQDAAAPSIELAGNGGIKFPGTQGASSDANTLDDYEEGTWTGVFETSGGALTMGSNTGTYTKVGSVVHCCGYFSTTSLNSKSGNLKLTGLPFSIPDNTRNYGSVCVGYGSNLNITAQDSLTGYFIPNSDEVQLMIWTSSGGTDGFAASQLSADGSIMVNFSYFVH